MGVMGNQEETTDLNSNQVIVYSRDLQNLEERKAKSVDGQQLEMAKLNSLPSTAMMPLMINGLDWMTVHLASPL